MSAGERVLAAVVGMWIGTLVGVVVCDLGVVLSLKMLALALGGCSTIAAVTLLRMRR